MNTTTKISIAAAILFFSSAAVACDYPARADITPGSSASKEEMLESQKAVKAYITAMETYLACLEQQEADAVAGLGELSEEEKATRDAAFTKKYNAAVEQMEIIAAQFNEEVRAYKAQAQ